MHENIKERKEEMKLVKLMNGGIFPHGEKEKERERGWQRQIKRRKERWR